MDNQQDFKIQRHGNIKSSNRVGESRSFLHTIFHHFCDFVLAASIGFWQLGKTEMAKAYIIPLLVAGILLLTIGLGLFFTNKSRITQFETAYHQDASAFVASEIERAESTIKEYKNVVFTAIPLIIAACALVIVFINTPIWRASMITTIAMLVVILLIDG
ncbi:MAG: hypothetical protein RJQ14_00685, partial [Marinoscillum sp.]